MQCPVNYSGTEFLSSENQNYSLQFPGGFRLNERWPDF